MRTGISLGGLLADLKQHTKIFLRDELQLAKAELAEKAGKLAKDAASAAAGGCVAYAGLIVFLAGAGMLLAFAFEKLGWNPAISAFVGLAIMGVLAIGIGAGLLLGGLKAMKKQSLKPERTIETLQKFSGAPAVAMSESMEEKEHEFEQRSPDELEDAVLHTENEMADTLQEITDKVTLKEFRQNADEEIREHPYRWGLVAVGLGLAGGYLLERNLFHKAEA